MDTRWTSYCPSCLRTSNANHSPKSSFAEQGAYGVSSDSVFQISGHTAESSEPPWGCVSWLEDLFPERIARLRKVLLEKLDHIKVDTRSTKAIFVRSGIEDIMNQVVRGITALDPRFQGHLVPLGSFYQDMKLHEANEFDFTYVLDLQDCASTGLMSDSVVQDIIRKCVDTDFSTVNDEHMDLPSETFDLDEKTAIKGLFYELLNTSLCVHVRLPDKWIHGGFDSPRYSGSRQNGPAQMLQFIVECDQKPMNISVDVALCLSVPSTKKGPKFAMLSLPHVSETSDPRSPLEQCWGEAWLITSKNPFRLTMTLTENNLVMGNCPALDQMATVARKVICLCKYLTEEISSNIMANMISDPVGYGIHILKPIMSKKIHPCFKAMCSYRRGNVGRASDTGTDDMYYIRRVLQDRGGGLATFEMRKHDLVFPEESFSSLGETVGEHSLCSSYLLKRIVLILMLQDYISGQSWTDDDIPRLIVAVFGRIHFASGYDDTPFSFIEMELEKNLYKREPAFVEIILNHLRSMAF